MIVHERVSKNIKEYFNACIVETGQSILKTKKKFMDNQRQPGNMFFLVPPSILSWLNY